MNDELLQVKVAVIDNIAAITSEVIETTSEKELPERMKILVDAILQANDDNLYEFILKNEEKEEFGQFIESLSQYWIEIEAKPEIEEKMFGLMISIIAHTDTMEYHLESKSLAGTNLAGELFNIAQKENAGDRLISLVFSFALRAEEKYLLVLMINGSHKW